MELKWIPVDQVALVPGVEYCVGRVGQDGSCVPDIGTYWLDRRDGRPEWECAGDEWERPGTSPVKFILNGTPLPSDEEKPPAPKG